MSDVELTAAVVNDAGAMSLMFAAWTLHGDGRLTCDGLDIQLPPKEWHVLQLLLGSGGALMTKDRLLELAWPGGEVAEESLTRCIYSLRKYLGADKGCIKTVYGRGYRFTCPVRVERQGPDKMSTVAQVCAACGHVRHG